MSLATGLLSNSNILQPISTIVYINQPFVAATKMKMKRNHAKNEAKRTRRDGTNIETADLYNMDQLSAGNPSDTYNEDVYRQSVARVTEYIGESDEATTAMAQPRLSTRSPARSARFAKSNASGCSSRSYSSALSRSVMAGTSFRSEMFDLLPGRARCFNVVTIVDAAPDEEAQFQAVMVRLEKKGDYDSSMVELAVATVGRHDTDAIANLLDHHG